MTEWEQVAKGEALAMAENAPPLERGQYVAWTEHHLMCTDHLSEKHMAYSDVVTLCGQIIPDRVRRLPVAYKSLKLCGKCALKYAQIHGGLGAATTVAIGG